MKPVQEVLRLVCGSPLGRAAAELCALALCAHALCARQLCAPILCARALCARMLPPADGARQPCVLRSCDRMQ